MNKILEINNLTKKYHTNKGEIWAVKDFSMDVYENDGRYTRQIDINSSIINELKQSRRVEPGRIIEL